MYFFLAAIFISLHTLVASSPTVTKEIIVEFCEHYTKSDLMTVFSKATKSECLSVDDCSSDADCEEIFVPGTNFCLEKVLISEADTTYKYKFKNLQIAADNITGRITGKCSTLAKADCEKDNDCESCEFNKKDICGEKTKKACNAAANIKDRTEDIMKALTKDDVIKVLDLAAKSGSRNGATVTAAAMVALLLLSIIAVF